MPRTLARPARGSSLVESLVGMIIALMVLGIALQLMLIARARYHRLADEALIEDRAMQALELIGRAVHQAGWITDTPASSSARRWPDAGASPSLEGKDDCGTPPHVLPHFECSGGNQRRSDALLVRFAGRSTGANSSSSDGATLDCGGYGVPERIDGEDPRQGYVLLFVGPNTTDRELELRCKSLDRDNPREEGDALGLVRGVETLQILYTLDQSPATPATAVPVSARAIQDSDWHRVRRVHVAIVVRGDRYAIRPPTSDNIPLFPALEPTPDAQTEDLEFRPQDPRRHRARFTATFAVRNPLRCEADAC
ncbi:hypothetical protein PSUB009319_17540 [Ralstonia sp. SET104]|nr:hypothetical protein PSUB009319_17540 [Ralstonia sp. SET104]